MESLLKSCLNIGQNKTKHRKCSPIFLFTFAVSNIWYPVRQEERCETKRNEAKIKMRRSTDESDRHAPSTRHSYDYIHFNKMLCSFRKQSQLKRKANWEFLNKCTNRFSFSFSLSFSPSSVHLTVEASVQKIPCGPSKPLFYIIKVVNHSHTNTRIRTTHPSKHGKQCEILSLFLSHTIHLPPWPPPSSPPAHNQHTHQYALTTKNRATKKETCEIIFMKKCANKL